MLPHSHNYLITPQYPDFDEARIQHHGPLNLDARIQALIDTTKKNGD